MFSALRLAALRVALFVLTSIGAVAQFGVPLNHTDPKLEPVAVRELVARYCRMDYAGARLSPSEWPKLEPLVSWRTNPDFPLFMVTVRFDVDPDPALAHGKYSVTVHYRSLGKFDLTEGYLDADAEQVQDIQFTVSEVNGDWRITEVEPNYPHPSRAASMQWVNVKLSETQDPVTKTIYQHALDLLQAQKASPLAK